jgi:hypothetical protein
MILAPTRSLQRVHSLATLFCIVHIVWCTVSYLLYLFACMCVFGAIDDSQFKEQQQDQAFEGPDQQHFEQGKWTLDHAFVP